MTGVDPGGTTEEILRQRGEKTPETGLVGAEGDHLRALGGLCRLQLLEQLAELGVATGVESRHQTARDRLHGDDGVPGWGVAIRHQPPQALEGGSGLLDRLVAEKTGRALHGMGVAHQIGDRLMG
jgi:hypothetical protein